MELEFHDLEYHGKLDLHKIEFQKIGRLLNISQTVVDPYNFLKQWYMTILALNACLKFQINSQLRKKYFSLITSISEVSHA